jgi:ankyrin repeat protein
LCDAALASIDGSKQAARTGIVVTQLLREGANPNADCDHKGTRPLMLAAAAAGRASLSRNTEDSIQIVRKLLEAGARTYYVSGDTGDLAWAYAAKAASFNSRNAIAAFLATRTDLPDLNLLGTYPVIPLWNLWGKFKLSGSPDAEIESRYRRISISAEKLSKLAWKESRTPISYRLSLTDDFYVFLYVTRMQLSPPSSSFDTQISSGFRVLSSAEKSTAVDLLTATAEDLEAKLRDCQAGGPNSAGALVDFKIFTVNAAKKAAPGWYVRYIPAIDYWAEQHGRKPKESPDNWQRFPDPSDCHFQLVPGAYRLLVEHPITHEQIGLERVTIGRQNDRYTFVVNR